MKRATSKDVARLAGVSQTTVSFVINNTPGVSLSDETRRKVLEAAQKLQYIPNSFAKGLKTHQSKLLGVFLPSMDNPFYPMLMKYIERYTAGRGYNVLLCCTYRNPEREHAYLDLCMEKQVDGIIYLFTPNWIKRVVQIASTLPVVLISEKSDDVPLNTISLNGLRCGQLMAQHLLDLGHRRIAYIMSSVTSISLTRQKRLEASAAPFGRRACRMKRCACTPSRRARWSIRRRKPATPRCSSSCRKTGPPPSSASTTRLLSARCPAR